MPLTAHSSPSPSPSPSPLRSRSTLTLTMTLFGFALTGVAALTGLAATAFSGWDCEEDCGPRPTRRIWALTGAAMAVTLSVGITGAWWLHKKKHERRRYLPEVFALKARRQQLVEALRQQGDRCYSMLRPPRRLTGGEVASANGKPSSQHACWVRPRSRALHARRAWPSGSS